MPAFQTRFSRRLWSQIAPYRAGAAGALVATLAATGLSLVPPALMRALVDDAVSGRHPQALLGLGLAMMGVPALVAGCRMLAGYLAERVGQGVLGDLQRELFGKLQAQSLPFFVSTPAGELASRVVNDVADLEGWYESGIVAIVADATLFLAALGAMARLEPSLTWLVAAVLPCLLVPLQPLRKLVRKRVVEAQDRRGALLALAGEALGIDGFLLRRSYGSRRSEFERFTVLARSWQDSLLQRFLGRRWVLLAMSIVGTTGVGAILALGSQMVLAHTLTIGSLLAFVGYASLLFDPVTGLANAYISTMVSLESFERLHALCELEPAVPSPVAGRRLDVVSGRLALEGVTFRYRPDQPLLEDVSLELRPGEFVGLVGPSGAGKTTLAYLLMRLLDPLAGRALLDGLDLREVAPETLEEHIGLVPQQVSLYPGSICDNLLLARPDAAQADLDEACRRACLDETIAHLPDGYDTVVGERGYRLSEGEKQRLAIARVLLKAPRILILDEPTSALDALTEARVQRELSASSPERTTLAIAHRLWTVANADRIVVLDGGRIVEQGTHSTLLARDGLYAQLHREQTAARSGQKATVSHGF